MLERNHSKANRKINEIELVQKINALRLLKEKGYDVALKLYPEQSLFLMQAKEKDLFNLQQELERELYDNY